MVHSGGYLVLFIFCTILIITQKKVQARYCEGGHKCSPPKECCAQGCCYLFSPPVQRPTPPTTDHVLNLFFINHWYFWCFVLAIVLALLCVCSLWKKRRQLCGWGSRPHYQSEGDSTGSCYAPPQYSRCNSFHHAPPPYMEVTSKPDLYPLVFSYTGGDNGKGGTNYLMVQYFRNYIVRPVGSLSAASTVDSLSSSFIRSVNEANTLVPPPYSRATSPDLSFSLHNYAMPRSTSQQACSMMLNNDGNQMGNSTVIYRPCSVPDSNLQSTVRLTSNGPGQISESESMDFNNCPISIYSNNSNNSVHMNLSQIECSGNGSDIEIGGSLVNNLTDENVDIVVNNALSSQRDDSLNNSAIGSLDCIETDEVEDDDGSEDYELLLQHNLNHYRNIMKMQRTQKDQQSISFESKESQINECPKVHRGYMNSNTDSTVSSLANLGSPASPPRPTSPTFEVREILEQIRQIQSEADNAFFDTLTEGEMASASSFASASNNMPNIHHHSISPFNNIKMSSTTPNNINTSYSNNYTASNSSNAASSSNRNPSSSCSNSSTKRKSLNNANNYQQKPKAATKATTSTKTNRDLYLPISNNTHQTLTSKNNSSNSYYHQHQQQSPLVHNNQNFASNNKKLMLRNSMTSNCILNRGRLGTRGWISKSAPTTPAGTSTLPTPFGGIINDSSPLLDEQDEEEEEHDEDGEQNV